VSYTGPLPRYPRDLLAALSAAVEQPPEVLVRYAEHVPPFRRRTLTKADGGTRVISKPHPAMRPVYAALLGMFVRTPDLRSSYCAYAGRGRGLRANAEVHAGAKTILALDLQNFFEYCSTLRIAAALRGRGFSAVSALLRGWCCVGGSLPQGAATSPFLADLAAGALDGALARETWRTGGAYTRYVDDLTFSWPDRLTRPQRRRRLHRLAVCVRTWGWLLKASKTRWQCMPGRLSVVGVVINEPLPPRPPRAFRRRLRAAENDPSGRWDRAAAQGARAYLEMFRVGKP